MKKTIFLISLMVMSFSVTYGQALQKFFDKYADDERFQYVSVNKGMSNMAYAFGGGRWNSDKMIKKMQGMKILTLEQDTQSPFAKSVLNELDEIIENGKFETLIETRDKGERVNIYFRVVGTDNADMIILTKEKRELTCIWIKGKLTREEMMNSFSWLDLNMDTDIGVVGCLEPETNE